MSDKSTLDIYDMTALLLQRDVPGLTLKYDKIGRATVTIPAGTRYPLDDESADIFPFGGTIGIVASKSIVEMDRQIYSVLNDLGYYA